MPITQNLASIVVAVQLFALGISADAAPLDYLRAQDVEHPQCRGRGELDVAKDYFVEVTNEVTGVQDYNELIRYYRRAQWDKFAGKLVNFRQDYPRSPLQEAADFVEFQSMLEQAEDEVGPPNVKLIEHRFQNLLLKYPNSELNPVIHVTAGNFWLQRNLYEKSLAVLERARTHYPFHSSKCVVLLGIAESRYLLNETARAVPTLRMILQKCTNPRIRLGAMIRSADIAWSTNKREAKAGYLKALKQDLNRFNRFYPHALYNLGEVLYREGGYSSAKFYFDEYLKHTPRQANCVPYALKRMADIAFKTGADPKKVIGGYMVARDHAPGSEIGRFAHVRGLLIDFARVAPPERERRIKIVDEELEKIQASLLRKQGYIEKGLALLDSGEPKAIEYLKNLHEKGHFKFAKPAERQFIRARIPQMLEEELKTVRASKEPFLRADVKDYLIKQVEAVYSPWLHRGKQAFRTRGLFTAGVLERFRKNLPVDREEAVRQLQQWAQSVLWDPKAAGGPELGAVAASLMENLWSAEKPDQAALTFMKAKKVLEPLVPGGYRMFWVAVAEELNDDKAVKRDIARLSVLRSPASIEKELPKNVRDFSYLVAGRAYRLAGRNANAEDAFLKVKPGQFRPAALRELSSMYLASKRYRDAYRIGVARYESAPKEKRLEELKELRGIVERGKLQAETAALVKLVDQNDFPAPDRVPFYHLAAKSYFDRKMYSAAVPLFEKVLSLDVNFAGRSEAQYKLGKCLLTLRRPAQAKQVWEELAGVQDAFWAPLARNELRILSQ